MKIPLKYLASIPMGLVLVAAWVFEMAIVSRSFPPLSTMHKSALLAIPLAIAVWAMFSVLYRIVGYIQLWTIDWKIRRYFKITPSERWK